MMTKFMRLSPLFLSRGFQVPSVGHGFHGYLLFGVIDVDGTSDT